MQSIRNFPALKALWVSLIAAGVIGVLLYKPAQPENMSRVPEAQEASESATPSATPAPSATPILMDTLSEAPAMDRKFLKVRVKPNETLWQIARKHCGTHRYADSIARYNGIEDVRKVRAGSELTIVCALK